MTKKLSALFLLLVCCWNSISQKVKAESSVGLYLETVTHDFRGNVWVGGSVWLLQGLLLRINSTGVTVITPPKIQTVQRLLFTSKNVAWMIADEKGLFQSLDGGRTWRQILRAESNLRDIAFPNKRNGWVVGWNGIIYRTDDGGRSWQRQGSGTDGDLEQTVFIDATHGWATGRSVFLKTTDGGKNWNSIGLASLSLRSIAFLDAQVGWAVVVNDRGDANLARTNNGGVAWAQQTSQLPLNWDAVLLMNRSDALAVGDGIIKTNDGGISWSRQSIPRRDRSYERVSFVGVNGAAIHVGPMDTSRPGDIIRTDDGGLHWRVVSNRWVRPTTNRVYREKFPDLAGKKR